jgi:thioredoxin reductase
MAGFNPSIPSRTPEYDIVIVGGGPAGLSAALVLGRACRRVLLCDAGTPRNAKSHALDGYLTRDGIRPAELRRIAREQLRRYDDVELLDIEVVEAIRSGDRFRVRLSDGTDQTARKLLLATGVVDHVPAIEGVNELYGRSIFHCPYCDGWEVRGQPLAIYGRAERGRGMALELTAWSRDLILCTDGPSELSDEDLGRLQRNGIQVREEAVARFEGNDGVLERIVFANGDVLARRAVFFNTGQHQRSDLPARLGCEFTETGHVRTSEYEVTNIPGIYVAGDAARGLELAINAAAEGARAAFAINTALLKEDLA